MSLLKEGRNCWKYTTIKRGKFLIDGEDYYESLFEVLQYAKESIYILGWEFHTETQLLYKKSKIPTQLGEFLQYLVEKNPKLHIYVLIWDFFPIYFLEREFFTKLKLKGFHERIHFQEDNAFPFAGSLHQKIVVVDDYVAFCGGLDITANRWDTREHKIHDKRRRNPKGDSYFPFHDVQVMVEGEAAKYLGKLARKRWFAVTGESLPLPKLDVFPDIEGLDWDISQASVAISRTEVAFKHYKPVREVEKLYKDLILSAKKFLYIENQYITSQTFLEILTESLQQKEGPEIVLVLPKECRSWFGNQTVCYLRNYVLQSLKERDMYGRLGVYYPARKKEDSMIYVHSKVLIADEMYAVVGSSNLIDRSFGLDAECNLTFDGTRDIQTQREIRNFQFQLLGEHLDMSIEELETMFPQEKVLEFIQQRRGKRRRYLAEIQIPENMEERPISSEYLDMKKPFFLDRFLDFYGRVISQKRLVSRTQWLLFLGFFFFVIIIVLLWLLLPFGNITSHLFEYIAEIEERSLVQALIGMLFFYTVSAVLFIPINALILLTATFFPVPQALFISFFGIFLNTLVGYGMGMFLGKTFIRKFFSRYIKKIVDTIQKQGVLSMTILRLLPIAPFSVVNVVAGAFQFPIKILLMGTFFGMLPGVLLLVIFQRNLLELIKNPTLEQGVAFFLIALFILFVIAFLQKRLSKTKP